MHTVKAFGAVVGMLPAVLGFPPVQSLVAVALKGGEVSCVLRLDLADATGPGGVEQLVHAIKGGKADGVIAVVVSEDAARDLALSAAIQDALDGLSAGVRVVGAVVVDRVQEGGRWRCADGCGASGAVSDPKSSVMAAAAVAEGRRLYGSRDEVVASVAVDGARAAAVARLMTGAGGPVGDVAAAVRGVVAVARRVSEGAALSDEDLAGVGAVLTDVRVRDVLFTLVDCEALAGAAEGLWLQVARVVGWPFRGEALCLLAHAGYVRGDGVLAG
ncbi:DUF4192 domain-containing protein, partial [Mycobacterium adipatum]|uniref:DUF4192 domain-containing protein n=1 Tax=Mycobacterium adipatum TaxID=1682113 RepID=UPI0034E0CB94